MEQKYETMRMLRHLNLEKTTVNGQVTGFTFNIEDFNRAISIGLKRQTRKRCVYTQTDRSDLLLRPMSPSVVNFNKIPKIE